MISYVGGSTVAERDLTGLLRDLLDGDGDRGLVVLGGDRRVLYANAAARTHLRDGTPRAHDPLLPAAIVPWLDTASSRGASGRVGAPAELHYPAETDRRLRLTLESVQRDGMPYVVLRTAPSVPWAEPTVRRLQERFRLTLREAQVAAGVARGLTNSEVALRLGIVEKTVKNTLMSVFTKCQVRNRVELALRAHEVPVAAAEPPAPPPSGA